MPPTLDPARIHNLHAVVLTAQHAVADLDDTDLDLLLPLACLPDPLAAVLRRVGATQDGALVCVACIVRERDAQPHRRKGKKKEAAK